MVVNHDKNLVRLTGIDALITDFDYVDIPKAKRTVTTHFSTDTYTLRDDETGEFLLLKDLFELAGDNLISIDMKDSNPEVVSKVGAMI